MEDLEDVGPCRIVKTTDKAVLIDKGRPGPDRWWIPFSCVDEETLAPIEEGEDADIFEVARWFAEKEGIE